MNAVVEELVARMPPDSAYPAGVVLRIEPKLRGRSFFPGGCGLYDGVAQPVPERPVMLVGQDFATAEWWASLKGDDEPEDGTWCGLKRMLDEAGVDPRRCFFTNVLLGVRVSDSLIGPSPGLSCDAYIAASLAVWAEQVRILRPCVVVAMGKIPTMLLAHELGLASSLSPPSAKDSRNPGWKKIDRAVELFTPSVQVKGAPAFAFATSVHPSRYRLNRKYRAWPSRGFVGIEAHDAVWREVALRSGVT